MDDYLETLLSGDIPREWSFEPTEYDARNAQYDWVQGTGNV